MIQVATSPCTTEKPEADYQGADYADGKQSEDKADDKDREEGGRQVDLSQWWTGRLESMVDR